MEKKKDDLLAYDSQHPTILKNDGDIKHYANLASDPLPLQK